MEERLRKFAQIIDSGSYTRAAEALHVSQPALSTALQKLERELGTQLVIRGKQPLALTEAGKLAYAYAKELSVQNSNFASRMSVLANEKPQVRIGMIDSVANTLLVSGGQLAVLDEYVCVSLLSVNNSRFLLQAVVRNDLDIALIVAASQPEPKNPPDTSQPNANPDMKPEHSARKERPWTNSNTVHAAPLGNEPLIGVTSPKQLKAVHGALAHGLLADFIGYDKLSYTSRLIHRHFSRQRIQLQPVFHSTSPEIILHMVADGRGAAVLPYMLVAEHIRRGTLCPFARPIPRPIASIQRRDKTLHPALATFNQTARTILARQNAEAQRLVSSAQPAAPVKFP